MSAAPNQPAAIRVAIVEDDDDIRSSLATIVSRAHGFKLVGQFTSAEEALTKLPDSNPSVVLMDIQLPGMNGIDCVRRLKTQLPSVQVVMLTVYEDSDQVFQSLRAGASGYLLKRTPSSRILESIRDVVAGGSPMTGHIARKIVQFFNQQSRPSELEELTGREKEVLEALARGGLYKEIADSLGISLDTVRKHLQSIYQKLHVHSRTDAVVKYLRQ
jgi:DNA-binding NarL/FixJ family response regulator